ncbi:MAG: flagellar hook-basal body complex protein FliE [Clostridium sp.]|nr:flagellar hook-basal body complex protein FliE [Clostridium sp.]
MQFNQIANNSISNYNKIFSKEMESFNINSDKNGMTAFDNVLNQKMENMANMPQGPIINTGIQMNVGLENMGVSPLERIENAQGVQETQKRSRSAVENMANDFGKAFSNGLNSVNESQNAAYEAAETFAAGGDISVHEVMLASQKANLTMQMAIQMRNRLVNAYNEINNVRV